MQPQWDFFLVCADEDTETAKKLDKALSQHELNCYPEIRRLKLGDSLREAVKEGLSQANRVAVIISRNFFAKRWTQFELNALTQGDPTSAQVVPVLHDMTVEQAERFLLGLADRTSISAKDGSLLMAAEELAQLAQSRQIQQNTSIRTQQSKGFEPGHSPKKVNKVDAVQLRRVLSEYFSLSDLETLSFDLGIDPDNLEGQTLTAKAMSLVQYCERRSMTLRLIEAIRSQRPNVSI